MRAIINNNETTSNARNYSGDKEIIRSLSAVVASKGKLKEIVTLRLYSGRSRYAQTILASVWVSVRVPSGNSPLYDTIKSGTGKAGGYGYCKQSEAASEAFKSAGISFDSPIGGRGMSVVREAIEATVRALGFRGQLLIVEN